MNCERLNYGKFSPELKQKLIDYGKEKRNNTNYIGSNWKPNGTDEVNYGDINVYPIDEYFKREIKKYFDNNNISHPDWENKMFGVQVVTGGDSGNFPPHRDPPYHRVKDFIYILDTGGDNVITSWWEVKNAKLADNSYYVPTSEEIFTPISEEILDEVESHKTEEDTWYKFNFSEIHSVRNIKRFRVAFVTWGDTRNFKRR